ncbi:unnamed protein product [marine sediment metagenome]|uniref:Uncharacterized protein n=1 Tax=marine sediment metagenome TaxID=412755 RepID=X0YVQ6_9ZZZZ
MPDDDLQGPRMKKGGFTEESERRLREGELHRLRTEDRQRQELSRLQESREYQEQQHAKRRSEQWEDKMLTRMVNQRAGSQGRFLRHSQRGGAPRSQAQADHRYNVAVDSKSMERQRLKYRLNKVADVVAHGKFHVKASFTTVKDGMDSKFDADKHSMSMPSMSKTLGGISNKMSNMNLSFNSGTSSNRHVQHKKHKHSNRNYSKRHGGKYQRRR